MCTLMTFENLAEPDWIQIYYSAELLSQVICIKKSFDKTKHTVLSDSMPVQESKTSYCFHNLLSLV